MESLAIESNKIVNGREGCDTDAWGTDGAQKKGGRDGKASDWYSKAFLEQGGCRLDVG